MKDPRRKKQLQQLVQKLGLSITESIDWSLLDLALTHNSVSRESNNEQLEFVGDSVVRLLTAEVLLATYPHAPVGQFSAVRSILVSDRILAEFAASYGLKRYLLFNNQNGGINKAGEISLLADAFEALLGALYLSTNNMDLIASWLTPILLDKGEEILKDPALYNYKDALQEWTQAEYKILPEYRVIDNQFGGKMEEERFSAEVWLQDKCLGKGRGRSKKAAEQAAAKEAYLLVDS